VVVGRRPSRRRLVTVAVSDTVGLFEPVDLEEDPNGESVSLPELSGHKIFDFHLCKLFCSSVDGSS